MDIIALVAGLHEGSRLQHLRAGRPEFVKGAEQCRAAVLAPAVDTGLGRPLRAALAARMARLNADETLERYYRSVLAALEPEPVMVAIAQGAAPDAVDGRLRAIIRHTDFVTLTPRRCTRQDIEKLVADGVSVPEIIALAELIGFLNFEVRILATLRLLEEEPA